MAVSYTKGAAIFLSWGSKMKRFLKRFRRDPSGTVTVDWIVICAAIVGLVVLILTVMQNSTSALSDAVAGFLTGWAF